MLPRVNSGVWMEGGGGEEQGEPAASWVSRAQEDELSYPSFKSMLEEDWYLAAGSHGGDLHAGPSQPPAVDSSSSCSPSSAYNLDVSPSFLTSKGDLCSLLDVVCSNPFDIGCQDTDFLPPPPPQLPNLSSGTHFTATHLFPTGESGSSSAPGMQATVFDGIGCSSPFLTRPKVLRPLETLPELGGQPTLFQKRAAAALRGGLGFLGSDEVGQGSRSMKRSEIDEIDDASIDGSGLNYDSDEMTENAKGEESGKNSNGNSTVTGGAGKGKKKGAPAKNLMAERRRRKKLNDRLYMLRSVVPKISKMDRASILGDAIEYLKELLQKINDLHNELETAPSCSLLPPNSTSFHPLTPTLPTLPCRVKEELCSSSLPSPNSQAATVEVRVREGRAVNIHMFCARRPGLLLSTMRALDGLNLEIQQAVISCFNGFALDVFRAEQTMDGPGLLPEEIKAVLLQATGLPGMM